MSDLIELVEANVAIASKIKCVPLNASLLPAENGPERKRLQVQLGSANRLAIVKKSNQVYFLAHLIIVIQTMTKMEDNPVNKMASRTAVIILAAYNVFMHVCSKNPNDLCCYVNGITEMLNRFKAGNEVSPKSKLSMIEILGAGFSFASIFTGYTLPAAFVFGFHWGSACKASFAGYWLLNECRNPNEGNTFGVWFIANGILEFGLYLFNFLMWMYGLNAAVFIACNILSLGPLAMLDITRRIRINILYSDRPENYKSCIKTYREIQLISIVCNNFQQRGIMMAVVILSTFAAACSLAMGIKSSKLADPNIIVLMASFTLTFDGTIILIVCIGMMATVYFESKMVIENAKKVLASNRCSSIFRGREGKLWRRTWKSFTPIKIKFGFDNFVEQLTPLNCLDKVVDYTVQLLLLDGDAH